MLVPRALRDVPSESPGLDARQELACVEAASEVAHADLHAVRMDPRSGTVKQEGGTPFFGHRRSRVLRAGLLTAGVGLSFPGCALHRP